MNKDDLRDLGNVGLITVGALLLTWLLVKAHGWWKKREWRSDLARKDNGSPGRSGRTNRTETGYGQIPVAPPPHHKEAVPLDIALVQQMIATSSRIEERLKKIDEQLAEVKEQVNKLKDPNRALCDPLDRISQTVLRVEPAVGRIEKMVATLKAPAESSNAGDKPGPLAPSVPSAPPRPASVIGPVVGKIFADLCLEGARLDRDESLLRLEIQKKFPKAEVWPVYRDENTPSLVFANSDDKMKNARSYWKVEVGDEVFVLPKTANDRSFHETWPTFETEKEEKKNCTISEIGQIEPAVARSLSGNRWQVDKPGSIRPRAKDAAAPLGGGIRPASPAPAATPASSSSNRDLHTTTPSTYSEHLVARRRGEVGDAWLQFVSDSQKLKTLTTEEPVIDQERAAEEFRKSLNTQWQGSSGGDRSLNLEIKVTVVRLKDDAVDKIVFIPDEDRIWRKDYFRPSWCTTVRDQSHEFHFLLPCAVNETTLAVGRGFGTFSEERASIKEIEGCVPARLAYDSGRKEFTILDQHQGRLVRAGSAS